MNNSKEEMRVINPTAYFYHQSQQSTKEYNDKISEFVKQLVNLKQCIMCKKEYNLTENIPRILIHCGHTLCQSCLKYFHKNLRVRCPLCLKLIKNIDTIERLPVNHTIFAQLAEDLINKNEFTEAAQIITANKNGVLPLPGPIKTQPQPFNQFANNEQNGFPQLDYCQFHSDRVKHFYCVEHKVMCCRACGEMMHAQGSCTLIDLYEIDDVEGFLNEIQSKDLFEAIDQAENGIMEGDLQFEGENDDEDEQSNKSI